MSQKERIRDMFFREVELSAIEIHLIAGISLKSTLKRIHKLRMQGVITKTNRVFYARGRKYAVYRVKSMESIINSRVFNISQQEWEKNISMAYPPVY